MLSFFKSDQLSTPSALCMQSWPAPSLSGTGVTGKTVSSVSFPVLEMKGRQKRERRRAQIQIRLSEVTPSSIISFSFL